MATARGVGTCVAFGVGCGSVLWKGCRKGRHHGSVVGAAISARTVAMGSNPRDPSMAGGDDASLWWCMDKEREEAPRLAGGCLSGMESLERLRVAMKVSNSSSSSDVESSNSTGSESAREGAVTAGERGGRWFWEGASCECVYGCM